ncbi:MAG TPA: hypothetical protein VF498_18545, partial [Anaerolineales bacterium]
VYVGTGEGALSGDSYFGNGVLKSINGGATFSHVGGNTFNQVSISKIVVDPTNPNHLYLAALSGVGGRVNVRPPSPSLYGIWESTDGGNNWTPRMVSSDRLKGATDLVMDPQNPQVLYASLWGTGIYKTTDGGVNWALAMNGLPTIADYTVAPTRFALGISHPNGAANATLYTGFEWYDTGNNYHPSSVWKSTDDGSNWTETSTTGVLDYCGSQCWYDNVIGVDPNDPNIVFALGLFDYTTGTGGVFRSMDGGATWVDLGWHQHPDFHAFAIRRDSPGHVLIGNDGGVWSSNDYGGRLNPNDTPDKVDWINLNGTVNPANGAVTNRSGLQIAQFTSIAQNPSITGRIYGGTQDNGTLRKSGASNSWFDMAGGDGGQVLVDPIDPSFVYGTYYQISPYRFSDGMLGFFFSNQSIYNGLVRKDRSAFYIPFAMDPEITSRLYLGSYRVYRTDNRGDLWQIISNDLTTGCTSRATSPTGVACVVTALGPNAGSPALYVGTGDGNLWLTTDATVASPTWTQLNKAPLPLRPVSAFAVDNSDYRLAYVAYSGFDAATPTQPGHVFKTTDGGGTWTNVSGDLPDIPVNSLVLDPSNPDTLYAGTDVGPYVSTDDGAHWSVLGSGFPIVAVGQLNLNSFTGLLRVGSYGRGAWSLSNPTQAPALQIRAWTPTTPLGPNSLLTYSLVVKNLGNAPATGVAVSDTIPAHTSFVAAGSGGTLNGSVVTWSGQTVPVGAVNGPLGGVTPGSLTVTMTVRIDSDQVSGNIITNEDFSATSAEGAGATGSPTLLTLAPANAVKIDPTSQLDGGRLGQVVTYTETLENRGYTADVYKLTMGGNLWPTTLWNATFTSQITQTGSVAPGATTQFGVKVTVPLDASNASMDTANVMATSAGNPAVSASASIKTIAVSVPVLVVDEDGNAPDVNSIYTDALTAGRYHYDVWDLKVNPVLPDQYLKAHKAVVWFTGTSYPGPLLPYESQLASYLNGGGRLFVSGMDLLDQAAGTTEFVKKYLHVDWDGSEKQNDKGTVSVTGVPTNTVTASLGTIPLDYASLGYDDFSDQITPIDPALAAFTDDKGAPDALTVSADTYKVMFLAFPYEVMGNAAQRADLMQRAMTYFGVFPEFKLYLPAVFKDAH